MRVIRLKIENFRGVKESTLFFDGHTVLVGDNNTGKSTVLEALDLVLGPERLSRKPVVNEHDFYAGEYLILEEIVPIKIEAIIDDLNNEQKSKFANHIEWWNTETQELLTQPPASSTDSETVSPVLRVIFIGAYEHDEDDFEGNTYYCSPIGEGNGDLTKFTKWDKRECGFLFLRTLRTGSRALSLERGTLLDIILRLKEIRPKMWEDVLHQVQDVTVATDPELGVSDILTSIQDSIKSIVPVEWADKPKMKVSNLTREHLRKILTVFIGTGAKDSLGVEYSSPFSYQGTGTINTLVLALLSMIAELKQNVIFAMEEPEIAIPPYTQKRIIQSVISKSAQALFTSHSPYVIEEFEPNNILVLNRKEGTLKGTVANLPPSTKLKKFSEETRLRFSEAILARRVLITEGRTEFDCYRSVARRLSEELPDDYSSFENLGIATIDAGSDTAIAPLGNYYKTLGKTVYAVFDKQTEEELHKIEDAIEYPYEAKEPGFEKIVINGVPEDFLRRYGKKLVEDDIWPTHLSEHAPHDSLSYEELKKSFLRFLKSKKGDGFASIMLAECEINELPSFITETLTGIRAVTIEEVVDAQPETTKE